jgi:putative transposase
LTAQINWLKKNLKKCLDLTGRVNLLHVQKAEIEQQKHDLNREKPLPLSTVSVLLDVNRTSVYYTPKEPSELEVAAKHSIDKMHTDNPSWGSRQLSKQLKKQGINIGRLKTRRYMGEMRIQAIYPKPNLSKPAKGHKVYPYLLRNAYISRANQAWSIDITYIRLRHGFIYLTAIIDWYGCFLISETTVVFCLYNSCIYLNRATSKS